MSERHVLSRVLIAVLRGMVRGYAWLISPFLGPKCRFQPTCSAYACQALERHGILAGLWLTMRRVISCHPWSGRQGVDPVPDQFEWQAYFRYKRGIPRKDITNNLDRNDETLTP